MAEIDVLRERIAEIEALAIEQGLDFFPTSFEIVPSDIMTEIAAYGLPTRARHWSYGKVYQSQRLYGEMGFSKIYEIVLNAYPALAFLLQTNDITSNLLVAAHVFGHVDFFKNNVMFLNTNRNMVPDATSRAIRVDEYIERYSLDVVEHLQDIGFALDRHINPHLGTERKPYPKRHVVERERIVGPYDDVWGIKGPSVTHEVVGEKFPPSPELDLLWFLITYAPIEDWQRDVLTIIREESHYFYPQFMTKIMNEGWASYWHAELFNKYSNLSPTEMLEFARLHAGVVNPGGRFSVNPYYLGYTILVDIEKRWDDLHKKGESTITGRQKLFEVRREEDDISFLQNYLTEELVERLGLFSMGTNCKHPPGQKCHNCEYIVITSRERDAVVESLTAPRHNYGMPQIVVRDVLNGILYLEHVGRATSFLDREFANKTLDYVAELWKQQGVYILTCDEHGKECNLTAKR